VRPSTRILSLLVVASACACADDPKTTAAQGTVPSATQPSRPVTETVSGSGGAVPPASSGAPSATATADQIDRALRAKGYTPRMINGQKYYCRREDLLGTRLQAAQQCAPADQLSVQERTSQEGVMRMQRSNDGNPKGGP